MPSSWVRRRPCLEATCSVVQWTWSRARVTSKVAVISASDSLLGAPTWVLKSPVTKCRPGVSSSAEMASQTRVAMASLSSGGRYMLWT
jgi:hypothetical protein